VNTHAAIELVAKSNRFNPLTDYLSALEWDGLPRLNTWLSNYLGAEGTEYTEAVGRCSLISAVARAFEPGCQVDTMLILEGAQGTGKTSAVKVLAGEGNYAGSPFDLRSKDRFQAVQDCWLYEMQELSSLRKADAQAVKAFVSTAEDTYRPPYGRAQITSKRRSVFIGTTNDSCYLSDATGARRFWPVATGRIDLRSLRNDRDQLWAEATNAYLAGEEWWLTAAGEELAKAEQEDAREPDPWEAAIAEWLALKPHPDGVSTAEALEAVGMAVDRRTRRDETRAGIVLRTLGLSPQKRRVRGGFARLYVFQPPFQPRSNPGT
jgi:putative DNA primase/helicase